MTMKRPKGAPRDGLPLKGKVEIWAYKKGVLFDHQTHKNILFFQGFAEIIRTLSTIPGVNSAVSTKPRIINRMAVGDLGTVPSDPTTPKVPTEGLPQELSPTTNGLYHEVYRKDVDTRNLTITPCNSSGDGAVNQCEFIATFDAVDVSSSAFTVSSNPVLNEVGLVIIDPTAAGGITRSAVTGPTAPPTDEVIMSIRCFKSIPFDAADEISVTIQYTLFME
jgi:hypothetical protein